MAAKKKAMKDEQLWNLWGAIEDVSTKIKLSSVPEAREVISNFRSIQGELHVDCDWETNE